MSNCYAVDVDIYNYIKEHYGTQSSWGIWAEPKNKNWNSKDSIGDMSVFDKVDINQLNSKYIFVGLNPNSHGLSKAGCKICKCYSKCSRKLDICNKGCEFCSCLQKCPVNQDVEDCDWKDFHSKCKRKTQDHKLRKAFNDINNREYWGSFMIDLYQYNERDSSIVQKMVSEEDLDRAIDILLDVWNKLGCHSTCLDRS